MTGTASNIVKQIFKFDSIDDVSLTRIQNLCEQYPFFGTGHYLLSKKLHKEKASNFLDETKKTALYFQNPFWLQWLLENESEDKKPSVISTAPVLPVIAQEETITEAPLTEKKDLGIAEKTSLIPENEPKEDIKKEAESPKEEGFVFNAYHTVDYFASLGIKLNLADLQQDHFGKQLRSFTDWLKTMKKLPQKQVTEEASDPSMQAAVEGYAALSIQQKEIITEAMAEVLAKQGRNEHAIELYRKLSLLNPSKSTYFAAKIEQTKA